MSELVPADDREAPRHGFRPAPAAGGLEAVLAAVPVLLAATVAVLAFGVVVYLLTGGRPVGATRLSLTAVAAAVVVLATAIGAAGAAARGLWPPFAGTADGAARGERRRPGGSAAAGRKRSGMVNGPHCMIGVRPLPAAVTCSGCSRMTWRGNGTRRGLP